jgi:hypothetical protein
LRFQVHTAASMMFRAVFWVILPCKIIVDHHFTRQYNPEDSSEHHFHIFFYQRTLLSCVATHSEFLLTLPWLCDPIDRGCCIPSHLSVKDQWKGCVSKNMAVFCDAAQCSLILIDVSEDISAS